jgi:hypothetical protein
MGWIQAQEIMTNKPEKGATLLTYRIGTGSRLDHEVRVERFFRSNWSLIYSAGYSSSVSGNTQDYRSPVGVTVGVGMFLATTCASNGSGNGFLMCCLIPDGIATHFHFNKGFDFSPYINFSGINFRHDKFSGNSVVYSPSVGFRLMKYLGTSFVISAEQSFTRSIGNSVLGSAGISISGRF